ncbi:hypothetical protein AVEN_218003-1 [Araneus ventricosus]|uniref:Uncharacterized protein n=1 Tax=Araneus ventricosus TaxID=182803 RepID=A0A4Y2KGN1_ARAVE|nr:hypothetical protein AVEN_218003-1 [Araneus ventricosus]
MTQNGEGSAERRRHSTMGKDVNQIPFDGDGKEGDGVAKGSRLFCRTEGYAYPGDGPFIKIFATTNECKKNPSRIRRQSKTVQRLLNHPSFTIEMRSVGRLCNARAVTGMK